MELDLSAFDVRAGRKEPGFCIQDPTMTEMQATAEKAKSLATAKKKEPAVVRVNTSVASPLKRQVEKVLSHSECDEREVNTLYELAETDKRGYLSVQEVTQTMQVVYEVELELFRAAMRKFFARGVWNQLRVKVYHFESQFASEAAIRAQASKYTMEVNRHHDVKIMRDDYFVWFMQHLAIPLDERIGIESAPLYSWSSCCRPPRFGLSKSARMNEWRKMGIFVGDMLCERLFLLKNCDGFGGIGEVPDVYRYLVSFLFELYESTNANMAYEFVHHGDFTSYELLNNLKNPDIASSLKLAYLLMQGRGPKSRLNWLNVDVTLGADVDPDEKERAEQIIAECAPELLERVENGTANPSECYMLGIMSLHGWAVAVNQDKADQLFERGSQGGDAKCCFHVYDKQYRTAMKTLNQYYVKPKSATYTEERRALDSVVDSIMHVEECAKGNSIAQAWLFDNDMRGFSRDILTQHENGVQFGKFSVTHNPVKTFLLLQTAMSNNCDQVYFYLGRVILRGKQVGYRKPMFNDDRELGLSYLRWATYHRSRAAALELHRQAPTSKCTGPLPVDCVPKTYVVNWSRFAASLRGQ